MPALLTVSRLIDAVSQFMGKLSEYMVLLCCLISAANALIRYSFNYSSNGWLEIQWYLFAFIVVLGAAHTLRMNEHVRVDLIYGSVSDKDTFHGLHLSIFCCLLVCLFVCLFVCFSVFCFFFFKFYIS